MARARGGKDRGYWRNLYLQLDAEAAEQIEADAADALERAGVSAAEQFERTMQAGGRKAVNTLHTTLRREFDKTLAQGKINLARGLIDPAQFREIERAAKQTFNEGILAGMDRLREEGKTSEHQLNRLANRLKEVGTAGRQGASIAVRGLERVKTVALSAAGAVGAIFALNKVRSWLAGSTELAARYETLGVTLQQVGQNAGYTAQQLDDSATALQKGGISMLESRAAAARLISAQIDLAHATDLARIAQDAAVIGNINSSEAFSRMIAGIASGQVETLRAIGLNVNFQRSYERLAAQIGKAVGDLTEMERAQARTNSVIEAGTGIAGTYAASLETAGKQAGSNVRLVEDLRIKIGQLFLPAYREAVFSYTDALRRAHVVMDFLIDNADEIVRGLVNLTRAIVVTGTVMALVRLRSAIRGADLALKGFIATSRAAMAALGPKGWFVLGVTALTTAFQMLGNAQAQAKREQEDYLASLQGMGTSQLDLEIAALAAQQRTIQEQIESASSDRVRKGLERNLQAVRAAALEAIRLRNQLLREAGSVVDPDPTEDEKRAAEDRVKKLWAHLGEWLSRNEPPSIIAPAASIAGIELDDDAREKLLEARRRRDEFLKAGGFLGGHIEEVGARTGGSFWEHMSNEAIAQLQRQVDFLKRIPDVADQVAYNIASSFQATFERMAEQGATAGTFIEGMLRGMGGAALASISQLAQGKVKENMAAALEAGARALGFLSIGNFPSQAAAAASAAQHLAAATAWGALAGGSGAASGAVTGGRGAVPVATRDAGIAAARKAVPDPRPIIFNVDPFNPSNPVHARNTGQAQNLDVRLNGKPVWAR